MNRTFGPIIAAAVFLIVCICAAFYMGRRSGRLDERGQIYEHARKDLADSLKAAGGVTAEAHVATVVAHAGTERATSARVAAVRDDSVARARRADARAAVEPLITDGSTTTPSQVDSLRALVRQDDSLLVKDSLATAKAIAEADSARNESGKLRAELLAVGHEKTLEHTRADLAESRIKELSPPRCGWKCGAVLGAGTFYVATHPKQVGQAFTFVVRLVR